jgi:hypothetical protein
MGEMAEGGRKRYAVHVKTLTSWEVDKYEGHEGEVLEERIEDQDTGEPFDAKIMVSKTPQEGYDELVLATSRGMLIEGKWFVKVLERIEEEEVITVFESKKLGDRRGYMLKSMLAEEKTERKKEIMTTDLEEKLKRKREIAAEILKKQKKE